MITVDAECISLQDNLINNLAVKYPNIGKIRANRFLQYFINTFFEGQFPIQMWNHYGKKYERTQN